MAQALLNNLNNVIQDGMYVQNTVQEDSANFAEVLNSQVEEIAEELTENITEDIAENIAENIASVDTEISETEHVETLADVIQGAELAAAIEYVIDTEFTPSDEPAENNSENEISVETSSDDSEGTNKTEISDENGDSDKGEYKTEENNISHNNKITENVIENTTTQEDPEMNTTLKNPTAVITPQNSQPLSEQTGDFTKTEAKTIVYFDLQKGKTQPDEASSKAARTLISEEMVKDLNIESVNGSSTQSEADLMQQQTPQEQAVKVMLQNEIKFEDVKFETVQNQKINTTPAKILEQITKQMEGMQNNSKINIVLNPEQLGRVSLKIVSTKDGLAAQFMVSNPDTQNILLKGISGLKQNLLTHGINVDNVVVKLSENESGDGEYNQDWTEQENNNGGKQQRHGARQNRQQEKNFEQMMFEIENT